MFAKLCINLRICEINRSLLCRQIYELGWIYLTNLKTFEMLAKSKQVKGCTNIFTMRVEGNFCSKSSRSSSLWIRYCVYFIFFQIEFWEFPKKRAFSNKRLKPLNLKIFDETRLYFYVHTFDCSWKKCLKIKQFERIHFLRTYPQVFNSNQFITRSSEWLIDNIDSLFTKLINFIDSPIIRNKTSNVAIPK